MRVVKCDSCGTIIDFSRQAYYSISAMSKIDMSGERDGWNNHRDIDICGKCWDKVTLVGLEGMVRGGAVSKTLPQLI